MTRPIEEELIDIFDAMQRECRPHRRGPFGSFGRGFGMHADARKVAPEWLRKWDDDNRWAICFTMDWPEFVRYASAFGVSKEGLLLRLEAYRTQHATKP